MFAMIKTFVLIFAYFAAFKLGQMVERPKSKWPKAAAGQNPLVMGDWEAYQKIYMGVVGVAVLLTLLGGMTSMGGGMGFGMGGGGMGYM